MPPIIAHLDLDAFFASCEQARNPDLADTPVVICMFSGRGEDAGAVSTCDYQARSLGIHAGMAIQQAKQIIVRNGVDAAFLQADKQYYQQVSERIMSIVADHVDGVEQASVDEAYADLSFADTYEDAADILDTIKTEITDNETVTASAGIGPNKFVAKMASDEDKPDGLTVVPPDDTAAFLADMPVSELHGVGPKTADTLQSMDVATAADLRNIPVQRLVRTFGEARGVALHEKSVGEGATTLEDREPQQLSRIETLPANTREMKVLRPVIRDLASDVTNRLEQHEKRYTRAAAIIITADREMRTRSTTVPAPTQSTERLYRTVESLVTTYLQNQTDTDIRRIGVRATGLEDDTQQTLTDF